MLESMGDAFFGSAAADALLPVWPGSRDAGAFTCAEGAHGVTSLETALHSLLHILNRFFPSPLKPTTPTSLSPTHPSCIPHQALLRCCMQRHERHPTQTDHAG